MSLKEEYISDDEEYYNSVIKTESSFDPLGYSQERRSKSRKRVSRFERSVIRGKAPCPCRFNMLRVPSYRRRT